MKRTIAILALIALAACSTTASTTLEQSAFAARSAYAAVAHLAAQYVVLPRCGPSAPALCSSQPIVNDIRHYDALADTATSLAASLARAPNHSAAALTTALSDAEASLVNFRTTVAVVNPAARTAQ
jgi:hypothetical protein